jgi:VIT1/CCC1 family predicted Fe2+/Mn2+ transporter
VERTARAVDGLIARLPPDDPEREALQAQAARYGRACGCSVGGLFLVASALLVVAYFAAVGELGVRSGLAGLAFVLVATIVGKLVGISLATLRLRLFRRSIDRKLRSLQGGLGHVHVH